LLHIPFTAEEDELLLGCIYLSPGGCPASLLYPRASVRSSRAYNAGWDQ
jgi:hypothetical protein